MIALILLFTVFVANCAAHVAAFNRATIPSVEADIAGYGMIFNGILAVLSLIAATLVR